MTVDSGARNVSSRVSDLMKLIPGLALASVLVSGCSPARSPRRLAVLAPATKIPLASMPKIEAPLILEHIKKLASDEFEGRKPGTAG